MADTGFGPVARRSVSDEVFSELRDAILTGRFGPGDVLPAERDLAASFAVNRHAVREALQRLQEASMVRVVQGGGTRVLDVRSSAGLDLLAHVARSTDEPDPTIIRDGLEMRRCIGVEAARLAAVRADAEGRQRIIDTAAAYGNGSGATEPDRAFWLAVVEASGNLAFRLALNSLVQAIDARPGVMDPLLAADRADTIPHADLSSAIADGDTERAAAVADRILSQALDAWKRLQHAGSRVRRGAS